MAHGVAARAPTWSGIMVVVKRRVGAHRPLAGWPTLWTAAALCAGVAVIALAAVLVDVPPGESRSSRPPEARPAQLDACASFSVDDARMLLGSSAEPGVGGLGGCTYDAAPEASWPRPTRVEVIVFRGKASSPDDMYDGTGSTRSRAVGGVGGSARWYSYGPDSFGMLDARDGPYTVRVWVGDAAGGSSGHNRDLAKAAARLTLAKLPAA